MQTENAEELELCLQYCWVGFILSFSLSVGAALCHMIITKQYSFLQNRLEMNMYLLTEWEGRTGKYLARGHGVRTERSEVRAP